MTRHSLQSTSTGSLCRPPSTGPCSSGETIRSRQLISIDSRRVVLLFSWPGTAATSTRVARIATSNPAKLVRSQSLVSTSKSATELMFTPAYAPKRE